MMTVARVPALDRDLLTGPVRRALESESAEVRMWRCRPISYDHTDAVSGGLFRVSGTAHDHGAAVSWSLVLKVVQAQADGDDPAAAHYWKREALAYQSSLLDDLPGGLAAPRCMGVVERPGAGAWLWLEDIADSSPPHWPAHVYGITGRHLGLFNGAYLTARPLPTALPLNTGWLRAYLARNADAIARLGDDLERPLLRPVYPASVRAGIMQLWAERERFLAALDCLPQTFCHRDAWRRNLFVRALNGRDQLVAIDWAFLGCGALGEELAPLVAASAFFGDELAAVGELEEAAFAGYLEGLRAAGWEGEARMVRLGYAAAVGLRYGPGVTVVIRELVRDAERDGEQGRADTDLCDRLAGLLHLALDRADEARDLLAGRRSH